MSRRYETSTSLIRSAQPAHVYLKESWGGEWKESKHLACEWLTFAASPSVSSAAFHWTYGVGMRQGELAYAPVERLNVLNQFVKVEIPPADGDTNGDTLTWYGWIGEDERMPAGTIRHGDTEVATGEQALMAYGLEAVLDRQEITTSWFLDSLGADPYSQDPNGKEVQLGHALEVNGENRLENKGNRSMAVGKRDAYLFAGDLSKDQCAYWSTLDLLRYLVAYHAPGDASGTPTMKVQLHGDAETFVPDWDRPTVRLHGRTLKQLLDELLDRRRLLGYVVEVAEGGGVDGDTILIRPFSYADEEITISEDHVIPANTDTVEWIFDTAIDAERPVVRRSASQQYDQVVAFGARVLCCGSISSRDANLLSHWRPEEESEHDKGASEEEDYPPEDEIAERQRRNQEFRAADRFARVYSYFGLSPRWDGTVNDGEEGGWKKEHAVTPSGPVPLFPFEALDLDPGVGGVWYRPDLRFERHLPLQDKDQVPDRYKWEYRPPYVVIALWEGQATSETVRWAEIDKLAAASRVELCGNGAGRHWSCSVRVEEDAPGVVLNVRGAPQYALAGGNFLPLPEDDTSDIYRTEDYTVTHHSTSYDQMIVTFAIRADRHVEASYPKEPPETAGVARVLRIDASRLDSSQRPEFWWIAPGTVTGVRDGKLERTAPDGSLLREGFVLRDDRDKLRELARRAYEWYAKPRQSISVTYRQALGFFKIGNLVTSIGSGTTSEELRSVVTSIRVDLAQREGDTHRTTVSTQWGELDVLRLL